MASKRALICSTARTGLAKSFRSGFNATHGAAMTGEVIRAAIDEEHADHDEPIGTAREIALFPPMTGG